MAAMATLAIALPSAAQAPRAAPTPAATPAPVPAASSARPITASDAVISAWFDGYMSEVMDRGGLPGGALVVVRDGRVILSRGYGFADYESRRRVDPAQTLFRQASVSKLFGWILVMQLVEQGRIDLDADVNTYLDFEIPSAFGAPVTMRHLMTHSAGFADRYQGVFDPDLSRPLRDVLASNVPARVKAPGDVIAYSNYGAALAGYIAERVAQQPYDQLVAEQIYRPVGMARSSFVQPLPEGWDAHAALGYAPGSRRALPFEYVGTPSAGAMTATPEDMGRFLLMLANGGTGENGSVIGAEALASMMRLDRALGPDLTAGFGHGFQVSEHRGVRFVGHGGNLSGTATDLVLLPDEGLGWYVAFNGPGVGRSASTFRSNLSRAAIARFVAPEAPSVVAVGPSTGADVAGTYLSTRRVFSGFVILENPLSLVTVAADDDGVLTVSEAKRSDGSLRRWLPVGRDRFVEEETGDVLVAIRNEDGQVVRFASGLAYSVAIFERAPGWMSLFAPLGIAALILLVFSVFAWPARVILSRGFKARGRELTALSRKSLLGARIAGLVILGTIVGWLVYVQAIGANFDLMFAKGAVSFYALNVASVLSIVAALVIVADAWAAWTDPGRRWESRIGATLTALAAVFVGLMFIVLHLASFSRDF
jgi:CubicO group peptidase (beta-lactamase class C family)